MSWYYTTLNGQVFEQTGAQAAILDADAATQAKVPFVPRTLYGPYATQALAEAAAAAHPTLAQSATSTVTGPVTDAVNGVVSKLSAFLLRGAEIALGIVLLAIAANAILKATTGLDPGGAAYRSAKNAASSGGKAAATAAVL